MKLHILGICGVFMGGAARLAQELGHQVSGSDHEVYPPMSDELAALGVPLSQGYGPACFDPAPELVIVGNALSRGNPAVERMLEQRIPYQSGPQWLAENILAGRRTIAVAGTHGKTTTTAILAWILHRAGQNPGFLIGGVAENFQGSARLGQPSGPFVVEADEYDTAFFDKRSKFVHYRPEVLIINNIEYDHADIFRNLEAIQIQFHHLLRTVPPNGKLIVRDENRALEVVLGMGQWTPAVRFGGAESSWQVRPLKPDYSEFQVIHGKQEAGRASWPLFGEHNAENALAAIIAADEFDVPPQQACESLAGFKGVRRRLQRVAAVNGIEVYDDFAHHPTAIARALAALRNRMGAGAGQRLLAVLELRSNTMKSGTHRDALAASLAAADQVFVHEPPALDWDLRAALGGLGDKVRISDSMEELVDWLAAAAAEQDRIVIMSNGGVENIHQLLIERLQG